MSVDAQRTLRSAITSRQFEPVYYLHGADEFRKDAAVMELVTAAVDPAARDFNVETLRGGEADPARLSVALGALPMLAERRAVVIRDVGGLRKGARQVLDQYLGAPAPDTVLVLVAAGDDSDATLEERATAVGFPPLGEGAVSAWLTQRARREGVEITPDATALLADAVGTDLAQAAGELEKLASYVQGKPIDAAAVEAIVGVRRGEELGTLLDAVARRDGAAAASLVTPVLAQPKSSAVQCVSSLIAQTLALGWGRSMLDAGATTRQLRGEYFSLLKQSGGSVGRRWGDAVQVWVTNLPKWSARDLRHAADQCLRAELALKDTRTTSDDAIVMTLVLAICAPGRAVVTA